MSAEFLCLDVIIGQCVHTHLHTHLRVIHTSHFFKIRRFFLFLLPCCLFTDLATQFCVLFSTFLPLAPPHPNLEISFYDTTDSSISLYLPISIPLTLLNHVGIVALVYSRSYIQTLFLGLWLTTYTRISFLHLSRTFILSIHFHHEVLVYNDVLSLWTGQ